MHVGLCHHKHGHSAGPLERGVWILFILKKVDIQKVDGSFPSFVRVLGVCLFLDAHSTQQSGRAMQKLQVMWFWTQPAAVVDLKWV